MARQLWRFADILSRPLGPAVSSQCQPRSFEPSFPTPRFNDAHRETAATGPPSGGHVRALGEKTAPTPLSPTTACRKPATARECQGAAARLCMAAAARPEPAFPIAYFPVVFPSCRRRLATVAYQNQGRCIYLIAGFKGRRRRRCAPSRPNPSNRGSPASSHPPSVLSQLGLGIPHPAACWQMIVPAAGLRRKKKSRLTSPVWILMQPNVLLPCGAFHEACLSRRLMLRGLLAGTRQKAAGACRVFRLVRAQSGHANTHSPGVFLGSLQAERWFVPYRQAPVPGRRPGSRISVTLYTHRSPAPRPPAWLAVRPAERQTFKVKDYMIRPPRPATRTD